jgi:hypothetical protein
VNRPWENFRDSIVSDKTCFSIQLRFFDFRYLGSSQRDQITDDSFFQASGTALPCFGTECLQKFKLIQFNIDAENKDMEEVVKNCAGVAYIGEHAMEFFVENRYRFDHSHIHSLH